MWKLQEFLSHWLWVYVEQNLASVILMCFGKSRNRSMMWFFCKVSKGFTLHDQEQLKYNRTPFKKSVCFMFRSCDWKHMSFSLNNIRILNHLVMMIVVRTMKIIQCAGAVSEMLNYDKTWKGLTEPLGLPASCLFFPSASHGLFLLFIKG